MSEAMVIKLSEYKQPCNLCFKCATCQNEFSKFLFMKINFYEFNQLKRMKRFWTNFWVHEFFEHHSRLPTRNLDKK